MAVDEEYLQVLMRTVSHDMSSALRAAVGFSKLLASQYGDQLDDKALHWLSLIKDEGERSQKQLTALSRYARLYAVDRPLESCRLADIAQRAAIHVKSSFPHCVVNIDQLPTVYGYADLWETGFLELFTNSAQYASVDTVCYVSLSCSHASPQAVSDESIVLLIEDNGNGVDPQTLERVVLPYQRGADGGSEGAGMGLAIVKRIVEIHGGALAVENIPVPETIADTENAENTQSDKDQPSGFRVKIVLPETCLYHP